MNSVTRGFGNCLRTIRKSKDITQEKFAEIIEINQRQLARIEAGESFVTAETLRKICIALDITPDVLFDFELNDIALKDGTNDTIYYKAIHCGNIIKLINQPKVKSSATEIKQSYTDEENKIDEKMFNIAKKLNKKITVDEFQDGVIYQTKIYKPDGTFEIKCKSNVNPNFENLKNKIMQISDDPEKIEFLNLSLDALSDKEALENLKYLIKGIELLL